ELEEFTTTETTTETTTTETTTTKTTTTETTTAQAVALQESMNKSFEKYRARIYRQGSVYRKKIANNTIEARATIAIAPDHDMNQQTRKRKLQPIFFQQGVFKSLTFNNQTVVVEMNGEDIRVPIKCINAVRNKL
ncbi:12626_t:CDS:2, partial [Gigaspora margarita]